MPKYVNEEHTVIQVGNSFIPVDSGNIEYQALVENNTPIDNFVPPAIPPTPKSKLDKLLDLLVQKGLITQTEADAL